MKINYTTRPVKEIGPGDWVLLKPDSSGYKIAQIKGEHENNFNIWGYKDGNTYFKYKAKRLATPEEILTKQWNGKL